jgi:hypothetical protein
LAQIEYDALGQLKQKKLAPGYGNSGLETLTYDYNIRGWMLGANRDYTKTPNSTSNYFGFDLGYDKTDIKPTGGSSIGTYASAAYNGNITGMVWKSTGSDKLRKYDFSYDAANRLTAADFNQLDGSSFNRTAQVDFSVSNLGYDANGNIQSMSQKGLLVNTSGFIDQLSYNYIPGTNKLLNVFDASNSPSTGLGDFRFKNTHPQYSTKISNTNPAGITDYTYDDNGNLVNDYNKDIARNGGGNGIEYNHLNLPTKIYVRKDGSSSKGTIEYVYDAGGAKLKKITTDNSTSGKTITTTTTYIAGSVFESKTTSPADPDHPDYTDQLQFTAHEEGRIRVVLPPLSEVDKQRILTEDVTLSSFNIYHYDYFVKDHLGNVRMVLTEEQKSDVYMATMEDENAEFEAQLFSNLQNRLKKEPCFDNESTNNNVQRIATSDVEDPIVVGAGIVLKVMAGDIVKPKVFAWFSDDIQGNEPSGVEMIEDWISTLFSEGITKAGTKAVGGSVSPSTLTP